MRNDLGIAETVSHVGIALTLLDGVADVFTVTRSPTNSHQLSRL